MTDHIAFIRQLVVKGGPQPSEYPLLDSWFAHIHASVISGDLTKSDIQELRAAFGEVLSLATMTGFVFSKPHGYAGDYEIIDRIYQQYISPDPHFAAWDRHVQSLPATRAVRNRKTYFHNLLDRHYARRSPLRVLKVATGPGRSMFEWLTAHPAAAATFECIEIDPDAIRYASDLNRSFLDRITFVQKNALRYRPTSHYDLIWAAGIFDYFNDRMFVSLLKRLIPAVVSRGEIVIGNFADTNPGRGYMELFDWNLHHRSQEKLVELALECDVSRDQVTVGSEPEGVNLFLHIKTQ